MTKEIIRLISQHVAILSVWFTKLLRSEGALQYTALIPALPSQLGVHYPAVEHIYLQVAQSPQIALTNESWATYGSLLCLGSLFLSLSTHRVSLSTDQPWRVRPI